MSIDIRKALLEAREFVLSGRAKKLHITKLAGLDNRALRHAHNPDWDPHVSTLAGILDARAELEPNDIVSDASPQDANGVEPGKFRSTRAA